MLALGGALYSGALAHAAALRRKLLAASQDPAIPVRQPHGLSAEELAEELRGLTQQVPERLGDKDPLTASLQIVRPRRL